MSEHSPEPWRLEDSGFKDGYSLVDATGTFIAGYSSDEGAISGGENGNLPDYRRIVACVNACRGIPTASLESADGIQRKLDQLLNAAQSLRVMQVQAFASDPSWQHRTVRADSAWADINRIHRNFFEPLQEPPNADARSAAVDR